MEAKGYSWAPQASYVKGLSNWIPGMDKGNTAEGKKKKELA